MLGRAVMAEVFAAGHTPVPVTHAECNIGNRSDVQIRLGLAKQGYDDGIEAVINCAGVTPMGLVSDMGIANTAGPHILADYTATKGIRLIHVSSDCVFSGDPDRKRTRYTIKDVPDPRDFYGRTKLAGEPAGARIVTVRCSFIGPESGLLAWLLARKDGEIIEGWQHAYWTGSTSVAVARRLVEFATMKLPAIDDHGMLIHLATAARLSKYDVLRLCAEVFGLKVTVVPVDEPEIDRSLSPDVPLQSLDTALPELLERWKHSDMAKIV